MARVSASAAPRRPRAPRTLVQKLAPVVLGFEAIVVFLVGLTIFGLKALPAGIEQWWGSWAVPSSRWPASSSPA